jgi:hypothetical protein
MMFPTGALTGEDILGPAPGTELVGLVNNLVAFLAQAIPEALDHGGAHVFHYKVLIDGVELYESLKIGKEILAFFVDHGCES